MNNPNTALSKELAIAHNLPGNQASVHLDMSTDNPVVEVASKDSLAVKFVDGPKLLITITVESTITKTAEIIAQ